MKVFLVSPVSYLDPIPKLFVAFEGGSIGWDSALTRSSSD